MIEWEDAVGADIDLDRFGDVMDAVLRDHRPGTAVSAVLTDDRHIRELNRAYRAIDTSTDVLSFELDDDHHPDRDLIGEIYISLETAKRQAASAGRTLGHEIAHLAIHGVLHLVGYEHDTDEGYDRMRSEEERYLKRWKHTLTATERGEFAKGE